MNKFNVNVWNRAIGDVLLILPYVVSLLLFFSSAAYAKENRDDRCAHALFFGILFFVISNLISAGIIK